MNGKSVNDQVKGAKEEDKK